MVCLLSANSFENSIRSPQISNNHYGVRVNLARSFTPAKYCLN